MIFPNKKEGDKIKLQIGGEDGKGVAIEVVNSKELENLKLPRNPEEGVRIVVCQRGKRNEAAQQYYNILVQTAQKTYAQQLNRIEGKLNQQNISNQEHKALILEEKAIALCESIFDTQHPVLATAYANVRTTYQALGQYERALRFQLKAIAIRAKNLGEEHPSLATSYSNIGLTYKALGQYEKALEYQLQDIATREQTLEPPPFFCHFLWQYWTDLSGVG